ncbi:AAA family ATPase [Ottowia testudinis]|uniref:Gluconokinase n=2 Tax=Ottowia testudinis TaxID=2816950 RepID=A0A975CJ69_9BURK|nr:AAA family ATPase [Ottowia testudinis]
MGVAGCGKSTVAQALAQALGWPLLEGDDFHSDASRAKMSQGVPLTDADRAGWLETLAAHLALARANGRPLVLTCSALKRTYRDRLRAADAELRFAYLQIAPADAQARVQARAAAHFFSPTLVANQFATLESPADEAGVICLDALAPIDQLRDHAIHALGAAALAVQRA